MYRISGKTEFDIFKNYYTTEKMESCRFLVYMMPLQSKNNAKSEHIRLLAARDFLEGNYNDCLEKYTESLRYASFNGREYAMALANRSATYFAMENYRSCLIDIDLSLQGDYPINLKPKVLIRRAKCFINMGNLKNMIETIDDCCNQMQDNPNIPKINRDNYMKEMKSMMDIRKVDIDKFPLEETTLTSEVIIEKNRLNPNVSASIKMKYNRNLGTDFIAARDIPCGEVLFVDKAYSIIGSVVESGEGSTIGTFVCDYCWNDAKNCVPCKTCINFVYCSELCLSNSWAEYHQWECDMFRSNVLAEHLRLPVRTLIKAAFSGAIFQMTENTKPCNISSLDQYLHIYTLYLDLPRFSSKCTEAFVKCREDAVLMVEYLKKTDFFTRLMSNPLCQKDYDTLVNFVGGLLIKHNILLYRRSLNMYCSSSVASINKIQGKIEVLLASQIMKCHAFCPVVSGVKISCESNTSMYFNGRTCIVKACKTIKAGNQIFRSGFNFTPMISYITRRVVYKELDINCECTACENISNNSDILNTYLCVACREFTVLELPQMRGMVCTNCKRVTSVETIESMIHFVLFPTFVRENEDLKDNSWNVNELKKIMNPNHELLYNAYKDLLSMHSKRENIEVFKKALHDFKSCARNRNGRFDKLKYVFDLIDICKAYFTYIQLNIATLRKPETMELLSCLSDVISEAKDIAEFNFPPFLRLFTPMEFYILQFRVAHVTLQD